jgi:Trk K+ transport system NAD-binding subunit
VGKRYVRLDLDQLEVKLVGFVHKGVRCEEAAEDATVAPGDVLILAGVAKQLDNAEAYLITGKAPAAGARP